MSGLYESSSTVPPLKPDKLVESSSTVIMPKAPEPKNTTSLFNLFPTLRPISRSYDTLGFLDPYTTDDQLFPIYMNSERKLIEHKRELKELKEKYEELLEKSKPKKKKSTPKKKKSKPKKKK